MLHKSKKSFLGAMVLLCFSAPLVAQTEVSGFYPQKNELTIAPSYSFKQYDRFYRGTELTEGNPAGLGSISSYIVNLYGEYGITNWLSASLNIPYIFIESETGEPDPVQGTSSVEGIQDLSVFLKGRILEKNINSLGKLGIGAALGTSIPIGNYEAEGVLSLGNNANTFNANVMAQLTTKVNFFTEVQYGYSLKDNSDFDVPNAQVYGIKLGYFNNYFYTHVQLAVQDSMDGLDIGTPEFAEAGGPRALPQTEVDYTNINVNLYIPVYKNEIGVSTAYNQNIDGRNFSKETSFSFGLVYKPL
ncbi:transporter [uncultured Aquimarina sp.]|uniref:transporter n=1 Tax=uncultured Aquimarina sp. TaxID=575652 RepID=UPI00261C67C4|nr:transporter [uncultured Aquimarina sp.]